MNAPTLKRALAKPPAQADRTTPPGPGMLGYAPGYPPKKKPPMRRARSQAQQIGGKGGAP